MDAELIITFVLFAVGILILYFAFKYFITLNPEFYTFGSTKSKRRRAKTTQKQGAASNTICPVCSSRLYQGENIFSRIYGSADDSDQICTIHGCPRCYPEPQEGIRRVCPVCGRNVLPTESLQARLFVKPDGHKHVHVRGCSFCYKKK